MGVAKNACFPSFFEKNLKIGHQKMGKINVSYKFFFIFVYKKAFSSLHEISFILNTKWVHYDFKIFLFFYSYFVQPMYG